MANKAGRPTESKKDSLIKFRVDSKTIEAIDEAAEITNQNRSEIIRDILPIISSKDFENMISLSSLKRLEQYSIMCKNYFLENNAKIKLEAVSERFPAFVMEYTNPILCIKYPTYKIRILCVDNIEFIEAVLKPILAGVEGISEIYETRCAILKSSELNMTFLPEVMCLRDSLEENEKVKDEICSKLEGNNIKYEIWPDYYIQQNPINIEEIEGQKYIIS